MRRFVADACVLVRQAVPGVGSRAVFEAMNATDEVIAPDWALAECANALWKYVLADRLDPDVALRLLDAIANADIDYQPSAPLLPRALELACLLGHPVYDSLYLALALVEEAPIVTTDRRLAKTAAEAGLDDLVMLIEGD